MDEGVGDTQQEPRQVEETRPQRTPRPTQDQPVMAAEGGAGARQLGLIFLIMLVIVGALVLLAIWGMHEG